MTPNRILSLLAFAAVTAMADNSGTQNLAVGTSFSFDKGAVVTSGADILFNGTSINLQGSAKALNLGAGGTTVFNTLNANTLPLLGAYNVTSVSPLAVNNVFAVLTNAPNYAAVLITAVSGSSVTLQYKTFGTTTGGGGNVPTITSVQNNYGQVAPNQANYGIAPGALFFVQGTALANTTTALLSSASPGLQTQVPGTGVKVTVSVGGTSLDCPLYYLSPTQIDAVLPGSMPPGTGTVVVTNGTASASAPIVVAQSAFGVLNYNGTLAATYDANNNLITSTNAANPGQTIVVWGSGVGYDPQDDDKVFPQGQHNLGNIAMQAYVGGLPATISYRGRSQYPGVDQIVLTISNGVTPGCWVSLAIVSGTPPVVSNGTTIPVAASGKTCSEPNSIYNPSNLQQFLGKTTIRTGGLLMSQTTSLAAGNGTTVSNFLGGSFQSSTITAYTGVIGGNLVSVGSCLVTNPNFSSTVSNSTPLDAGPMINVTGPQGSLALTKLSLGGQQVYAASNVPTNFIPASGGPFTFDNATGGTATDGTAVGHFNTTSTFPANFTWTNPSVVSPIDRTAGVTVTWSGGAPGVTVQINGNASSTLNGQTLSGSFTCLAPLSAGTFTVPQPVLLALPAGSGQLSLTDAGSYQTFTATGLDFGFLSNTAAVTENVIYK
jgi:uncharacterized protein (TIGR03437 family)